MIVRWRTRRLRSADTRAEHATDADTIGGMRFGTVVFDLDGTLIDSGAMILASFKHATQTVLEREFPDEEILGRVGGMHIREHMAVLSPDRVDELVAAYTAHNDPLQADLQPCRGMLATLDRLRAERRRLGIATSKRRRTVARAFEVLPLEQYFDAVVTVEDTARHKPHPDPILHALELLGTRAEDSAYVGDSPFDIAAAKAAGVFAVAVTWGGIHAEERLRAEEPDAVVHDAEELFASL